VASIGETRCATSDPTISSIHRARRVNNPKVMILGYSELWGSNWPTTESQLSASRAPLRCCFENYRKRCTSGRVRRLLFLRISRHLALAFHSAAHASASPCRCHLTTSPARLRAAQPNQHQAQHEEA
jgi:hypothetical protein